MVQSNEIKNVIINKFLSKVKQTFFIFYKKIIFFFLNSILRLNLKLNLIKVKMISKPKLIFMDRHGYSMYTIFLKSYWKLKAK